MAAATSGGNEKPLQKGDVYINRKLEKDYPLMAAAIMAEESISSIIMLWDISWEQMNLAQSNRLRVVSYMIQNAVLKANRYIEMIENERYVEGTKLLETQAFKALLDAFINARKRGLADCSIIKINPGTKDVKEAIHNQKHPRTKQSTQAEKQAIPTTKAENQRIFTKQIRSFNKWILSWTNKKMGTLL